MSWIAAKLAEPRATAALADALQRVSHIRWFASSADLLATLRFETPAAVIVPLRIDSRDSDLALIRQLRMHNATVPVVGYCCLSSQVGQILAAAVRSGINAVALQQYDDVAVVLQSVINQARDDCVSTSVVQAVQSMIPRACLPVFQDCVTQARLGLTVSQLAARHGMHRATLATLLRSSGMFPARESLMWGKLLVAANIIDTERRSLEHIAHALELSGSSALSSAFRRYIGQRPSSIVAGTALCSVGRALQRRLERTTKTAGE